MVLQVALQDVVADLQADLLAADGHGLEQQQHPPGQVTAVVGVETDPVGKWPGSERAAEVPLAAGSGAVGEDVLQVRDGSLHRPVIPRRSTPPEDQPPVAVAGRRQLEATPRAEQHQGAALG